VYERTKSLVHGEEEDHEFGTVTLILVDAGRPENKYPPLKLLGAPSAAFDGCGPVNMRLVITGVAINEYMLNMAEVLVYVAVPNVGGSVTVLNLNNEKKA
jgi:hypothetical protein